MPYRVETHYPVKLDRVYNYHDIIPDSAFPNQRSRRALEGIGRIKQVVEVHRDDGDFPKSLGGGWYLVKVRGKENALAAMEA